MAQDPALTVNCPACGIDNPVGFVWCRKCKGALAVTKKPFRWPLPPAVNGALVGGALVALIFLASRKEPNIPADVAAGGPATDPSKASKAALDAWASHGKAAGKASTAEPSMTVSQDQEPVAVTPEMVTPVAATSAVAPASAAPAEAPKAHLTGVHQEGDKITYDISVPYNGRSYPVTVSGHVDSSTGQPQFVPDDVNTGGLPVSDEEVERMLGEAFAGRRPGKQNGGGP